MKQETSSLSASALEQLEALAAQPNVTGGVHVWLENMEPRVKNLIITALKNRSTAEVHRLITSWDGPIFPYSLSTLRGYVASQRNTWENQKLQIHTTYRAGA